MIAGVFPATAADEPEAGILAQRLRQPLLPLDFSPRRVGGESLYLEIRDGVPFLRQGGAAAPGPVTVDFASAALAHRRKGGHNELLGKAVGWRSGRALRVIDGTAGWGQDAFVLADLGCQVTLCERSPIIALLLELALERAQESADPWLLGVTERMKLLSGDVRQLGPALPAADVIYLDPMFREARKALPGKEMQLLHRVLDPAQQSIDDPQGESLLLWAVEQPVRTVVVKRARRAPPLPGPKPGHVLTGKAVRFDVYPLSRA